MKTILDISKYNVLNSKDYDDIAKGYAGVIMRIGYTGYGKPAKSKVSDTLYEKHDAELRKRGVPLGVYWYGTDESPAEAVIASDKCLSLMDGKSYPLGVFYDTEDTYYQNKMGKNLLTDTILAFTNRIKEKSSYIVGVYASSSWYKDKLHFDKLKDLIIWEAHYGKSNDGKKHDSVWYDSHLHQYTSNHMINGKRFDDNVVLRKWWDTKPAVKPDPKPQASGKFKIGDDVTISGQLYTSSNMKSKGSSIAERKTKITRYVAGAKAPYNTTGDLGWITEAQIKNVATVAPIKAGDKVKVLNNVQYTGGRFGLFFDVYEVFGVSGDRAVIGITQKGKQVVTTAINVGNIRKV